MITTKPIIPTFEQLAQSYMKGLTETKTRATYTKMFKHIPSAKISFRNITNEKNGKFYKIATATQAYLDTHQGNWYDLKAISDYVSNETGIDIFSTRFAVMALLEAGIKPDKSKLTGEAIICQM